MKRSNFKSIAVVACLALSSVGFSAEMVKWVGVVQEKDGTHTPRHDRGHELSFVRQSDGKSFDIEENSSLVKTHSDRDRNLLVEVEAELTPKFLFWGGNLVVKNFAVMQELNEIPHQEAVRNVELRGKGRSNI